MARLEVDTASVTRLHQWKSGEPGQANHAWLVPHLISLMCYAERNGLIDVEKALASATEAIAPAVRRSVRKSRRPSGSDDTQPSKGIVVALRAPASE